MMCARACTYCYYSMPKGTCQTEVTSHSTKIKSIALISYLLSYACLKALVSKSVSQSVENSNK